MQAISRDNDIANVLKIINLRYVLFLFAEIWKFTPSNVIVTSSKKLWPSRTVEGDQEKGNARETADDVPNVLKTLRESNADVDNEDLNDYRVQLVRK